ncbi:MAG: GNAT family N-acetyltransferase [Caulobacteraceae bacterium]
MIDLALARRRVRALYRHDRRGRMVSVNEWSAGAPPKFFMMRTAWGAIARVSAGVPDDPAAELIALAAAEPLADPPYETPRSLARYLALLNAASFRAGPAFVFTREPPPAPDAVTINEHNAELLRGGFEAWLPDVGRRGPFVAIIVEGRAVSLCASVRITPFVHCAGVETLPAFRRQGHGARVASAWARAVRRLGATPFYSTSWDNLASRAVARRLGLELAGVDFQVA